MSTEFEIRGATSFGRRGKACLVSTDVPPDIDPTSGLIYPPLLLCSMVYEKRRGQKYALTAMALSNVIQTVPDPPLPPSRGDLRGVIQVWNLTLQKLLNAIAINRMNQKYFEHQYNASAQNIFGLIVTGNILIGYVRR